MLTTVRFNWKINTSLHPGHLLGIQIKSDQTKRNVKAAPSSCQGGRSPLCTKLQFPLRVGAIKHVLDTVRRITTNGVLGLSSRGSVEGHLFLVQRAQTGLGPETEKRKGTKWGHPPRQVLSQPVQSPTSQPFYCSTWESHVLKLRHCSQIKGAPWDEWLSPLALQVIVVFRGELLGCGETSTLLSEEWWKLQAVKTEGLRSWSSSVIY